ncbi:MAG: hypothetical protein A3K10_13615 [Bacteroidetes bacterium RIFCSPLOWO2_12_FULL_31_6]|nr:MAG: hypothetical protein A3K10_13615 [Bacteroidetes bacterium RIFCSPLOWO2_12_FULL_31_6]
MSQNKINIATISIIVPVKNNQTGINKLLDSFFKTQEKSVYPKELIIVDNNSNSSLLIAEKYLNRGINICVEKCSKIGPAAARNMGAKKALGDWLFFTDSDCVFTETTIEGYLFAKERAIAYAGKVVPLKQNIISDYYKSIKLLNPPLNEQQGNQSSYIITANCLIRKAAFENVNGFNEEFELASGEDVDLGIRLAKVGKLYFASQSIIKHDFENNLNDFYKRFYRYGMGLTQLEKIHNITISIDEIIPKNQTRISFFLTLLLKMAIKKGKNSSS